MKNIYLTDRIGRLGNVCYRLANFMAFCWENDIELSDTSVDRQGYADGLPFLKDTGFAPLGNAASHDRIARRSSTLRLSASDHANLDLDGIKGIKCPTVTIDGFHIHASPRDLATHAPRIKRVLDSPFGGKSAGIIREARQTATFVCAVAVRISDFKLWKDGRYCASIEEYLDAMRATSGMLDGDVKFLIFKDQDSTDVSGLNAPELDVLYVRDCQFTDWKTMSLCDFMIGTNYSTYSGWASWHGNVPFFKLRDGKDIPGSLRDFAPQGELNNRIKEERFT